MDFCNIRRLYRRWFYNLNGGFFVRTAVGFKNLFYKFVAFIHFLFTFRVPGSSSLRDTVSHISKTIIWMSFSKEKLSLLASNLCPQEEACQLAFSLPWSSLIGHLVLRILLAFHQKRCKPGLHSLSKESSLLREIWRSDLLEWRNLKIKEI